MGSVTSPRPSLLIVAIVTTLGAVKCCRSVNLGLCCKCQSPRSTDSSSKGSIRFLRRKRQNQEMFCRWNHLCLNRCWGQSCHVELRKTQQGVNFPCKRARGTRRTHMKTATASFSCTLGNKAYGMVLNMPLQRFPRVCCLSTSVRAESPPPPHN